MGVFSSVGSLRFTFLIVSCGHAFIELLEGGDYCIP